jgi:hypothetical protein
LIRAAGAVAALALALTAAAPAAEPAPPFLRIGLADAPPGAIAIEAERGDIVAVERSRGHGGRVGITLRLDARFDLAMARMTEGKDGAVVVIHVCGEELLRVNLRGAIPAALFTLSLEDPATRQRVEAALAAGECGGYPSS